jgi:perosamine synthetase
MSRKDNIIARSIIKSIKKVVKNKNASELHEPELSTKEWSYLKTCLANNMLSTIGPNIKLFENKLKKITNSKYVIATINGTSALHLALKLINLKNNEEVLIPSLNFIASTNATLYCGGIPHFIDVEENTLGIDVQKLSNYLKKITKLRKGECINKITKRKIKAVIPTHLFGHPVEMKKLLKLAKKFNLKVIEDAAEGIGSFYYKKHLGTFGDFGVISFNGNKSVTTGGGGALLTNNNILAKLARHLITVSKKKHEYDLIHDKVGYNYKMTNLHAAIGCAQLDKIKQILNKKRKLHQAYLSEFNNNSYVKIFKEPNNSKSNFWLNTIILKKEKKKLRNRILKLGKKYSLGLRPVWKPLPELKFLKNYPKMNVSQSKKIFNKLINLPSSPHLI